MKEWKTRRFKYLWFTAVFLGTRSLLAKAKMKKYGIWHKPDEEPDFSKGAICVVYECNHGFSVDRDICDSCGMSDWKSYKLMHPIIKWAYRGDFMDVITADYPF